MKVDTVPVTVLMSVHNGVRFLREALDSVLNQNFESFEFLIIDDASTDNTAEILSEFSRQDVRVRVIHNEINLGLTKSLNIGLLHARGFFIARIDADDLCEPDRLKLQYKTMMDNRAIKVLGSSTVIIDENGQPLSGLQRPAFTCSQIKARLFFSNPITHSSVMFQTDVIRAIGGYDESFRRAQDYDLWLRCLASDIPMHMIDVPLVKHRYHEHRVTVTQPSVMKESRCAAVQKGFHNVLGLDFSKDFFFALHELIQNCVPPNEFSQNELLRSLRQAQVSFKKRFKGDRETVSSFQSLVRKFAWFVLPDSSPDKQARVGFAAGNSVLLYSANRSLGFSKRLVSRIRINLGNWRRKFVRSKIEE